MKNLKEHLRILYKFESPRVLEEALELRSINDVETIKLCYCNTWLVLYLQMHTCIMEVVINAPFPLISLTLTTAYALAEITSDASQWLQHMDALRETDILFHRTLIKFT